jgi:hypothetical protein
MPDDPVNAAAGTGGRDDVGPASPSDDEMGSASSAAAGAAEQRTDGETAEPAPPAAHKSWFRRVGDHFKESVSTWLLALVVLGTLGFIAWFVRPWDPALPIQEDAASLWSRSIARLGIEPVFPPQEDFHVGDVLAVIAAYEEPGGVAETLEQPSKPLLRKSIKIGHIKLRHISMEDPDVPDFASSVYGNTGELLRDQPMEEQFSNVEPKIRLTLVPFPSVRLTGKEQAGGSNSSWLPFSADREKETEELVTISDAASYGASVPEATILFHQWCDEKELCEDEFVRKILSFTTNREVLKVADNKYVYLLEVKLISRVYLTRKITVKRSVGGKVSASALSAGTNSFTQKPQASPEGADGVGEDDGTEAEVDGSTATDPPHEEQADGVTLKNYSQMSLGLDTREFTKPVVFGFKAITFSVDRSSPSRERAENPDEISKGTEK